ncbi:hypothetical protein I7I48_04257 [Histoplasma ohiense]|nr:hypothetical protein I7I48_04257 [Histoplasma ohiense (nom. inval.)]
MDHASHGKGGIYPRYQFHLLSNPVSISCDANQVHTPRAFSSPTSDILMTATHWNSGAPQA